MLNGTVYTSLLLKISLGADAAFFIELEIEIRLYNGL